MEENNRKGPGVFYAVVGVATLVVAIIGATFAYFSASTGAQGSDVINNETQFIDNASLTLNVERVVFNGTTAAYDTLVPAFFGASGEPATLNVATPASLTATEVGRMLTAKCEKNGYTGCHVYRITISSTQTVANANLLLNLSVGNNSNAGAKNVVDKDQWGYVVFNNATETRNATDDTKTDSLALGSLNSNNGAPAAIGTTTVNKDIHNNAGLTAGTNVVYYLLVYVNDTDVSQNSLSGNNGDANYVVGSYTGTLELQALGGKVRASFTA